mmetsp:Transcript_27791/g.73398  ORF Transcript_27791/g.73398 Transcript_27791/m.73398 type:complete len:223 (-) Transcript_27791:577-1245(-)
MGGLGVDHLVVESWTFREAATHGAYNSRSVGRKFQVDESEGFIATWHQTEVTCKLQLLRHLHEISMDEEAIRKPSRFSDALQLLVSVTAIGITNGTNHHQLRFGVRVQHPLRNIRDVVHPLLFHPSSKEHKKTTSISIDILPETVLLLHRQLCVAPHRQELSFRQVRQSRPLFLRHRVVNAFHPLNTPEQRKLLHNLFSIIFGHGAHTTPMLPLPDPVNRGL